MILNVMRDAAAPEQVSRLDVGKKRMLLFFGLVFYNLLRIVPGTLAIGIGL